MKQLHFSSPQRSHYWKHPLWCTCSILNPKQLPAARHRPLLSVLPTRGLVNCFIESALWQCKPRWPLINYWLLLKGPCNFTLHNFLFPLNNAFVSAGNLIYRGASVYNRRLSSPSLVLIYQNFGWLHSAVLCLCGGWVVRIVCFVQSRTLFFNLIWQKAFMTRPLALTFQGRPQLLGWLNQILSYFRMIMGQFSTAYQVTLQSLELSPWN